VEQRERARRALEAERERSERLLLNVLPGPIAERLKVGTGVIADHYGSVSVLFADLVGFTERSLVMAADELVALLDEIFSAFDRLAMRRASRRSRRSAMPIWWRASCHYHVGTTSRRSPRWRSRCGTRSRRSENASPSRYRACGACDSLPLPGRDKLEMQVPHLLTRIG